MSVQNHTNNKNEVGRLVQEFVDQDLEEIVVAPGSTGGWNVTGDRHRFWSWLLTPTEVEQLQNENERIRSLARHIQDAYDRYVNLQNVDEYSSKEALHQINLFVKKLLR